MNSAKAFLEFMAKNDPKLVFTEHFQARKDTRNIGEKLVEDFVLNKPNDLIYAEETSSNRGKRRFKLYYVLSKRKVLFLVLDVDEPGFLRVVTAYIIDKRLQIEAVRNANKYTRFATRLRR